MMLRLFIRPLLFWVALLAFPTESRAQTLRGSPASVNRIYQQAIDQELSFFPSATAIRESVESGDLVRLTGNADYTLSDVSYPYAVPAAQTFVVRLASQYRSACGEQLVVTSATRPAAMRLVNSVDKTVHPTGMAIDLRKPTNSRCLTWLRKTLLTLNSAGVLEAVEEFNPPHFHVAVFPTQYGSYVSALSGTQIAAAAPAARATTAVTAAPSRSSSSSSSRYRVRAGDSLWTIARKNNISVQALQAANNLRGSRIVVGQTLVIPAR
jgi:LysM repeat protein